MRRHRILGTTVLVLAATLAFGGTAQAVARSAPYAPHEALATAGRSPVETVMETGTANGELIIARCPAGTRAVGGGVRTHEGVGSARGPDPNTPVTVYAVCT
ncbi:hypothetical protein [Streptomyces chryseus]|uniref:hypothetical protein n=1 Tax=Streptomyces chryseus TaxID=68186 RepID=UPI00110FE0FD|nr:hypothetical protein [Streptomyces chryseus]GGX18449.1 hypothetical protein GCM10010353_37040 [Streptomyces chryseus]